MNSSRTIRAGIMFAAITYGGGTLAQSTPVRPPIICPVPPHPAPGNTHPATRRTHTQTALRTAGLLVEEIVGAIDELTRMPAPPRPVQRTPQTRTTPSPTTTTTTTPRNRISIEFSVQVGGGSVCIQPMPPEFVVVEPNQVICQSDPCAPSERGRVIVVVPQLVPPASSEHTTDTDAGVPNAQPETGNPRPDAGRRAAF